MIKITEQLEEANSAAWLIGLELSKLNEQIEDTLKEVKEKGIKMRSV